MFEVLVLPCLFFSHSRLDYRETPHNTGPLDSTTSYVPSIMLILSSDWGSEICMRHKFDSQNLYTFISSFFFKLYLLDQPYFFRYLALETNTSEFCSGRYAVFASTISSYKKRNFILVFIFWNFYISRWEKKRDNHRNEPN